MANISGLWNGTLTLDQSTHALAVLAWRRGMTKKRFNLKAMHAQAKVQGKPQTRGRRPAALLTSSQSLGMVKRRR